MFVWASEFVLHKIFFTAPCLSLSLDSNSKNAPSRDASRIDALPLPNRHNRLDCSLAALLKEPRCKVLKIASPGLPFVVGSGRFVEDVLDVRVEQRSVQSFQARAHTLGFSCADADPEQMHFFGKRAGVRKYAVVIGFGIELAVSKHEHTASPAESSDVGEEIQMIKRDLESLHSAHGEARHSAMIAIRKCLKAGIDVWD